MAERVRKCNVAAGFAALLLAAAGSPAAARADQAPLCADGDAASWQAQMDDYARNTPGRATQLGSDGSPAWVGVELPPIAFTGEGRSATLPVGPCQTIYRFAFAPVEAEDGPGRPFHYVEIDWNTEGLPRGPGGSFVSPHFDVHFYLRPRAEIASELACPTSNGRTCDPMLTDYAQMRRFLSLPEPGLVPGSYRPDPGSSIPAMGLHHLDADADYTVEAVNRTPVLLYGTFDGAIVFAEASVTLYTLQDAAAAPGHRLAWPYPQPESFAGPIDWPTEFVIEHLPGTGGFRLGFSGFRRHGPQ